MAWLLGCVSMRLLLAFLTNNKVVIFVVKHVTSRCWISQAIYLPATAQILLVVCLLQSYTLLLIVLTFFTSICYEMVWIAFLRITLKQKFPKHGFVYFLLDSLFVQPNWSFVQELDVLLLWWLFRINHLDLALTKTLVRYPIAQVEVNVRHWDERLTRLVFMNKLRYHSKSPTVDRRPCKLRRQIQGLVELVTCYAVDIGASSWADHLCRELFPIYTILLPFFIFCNATPKCFSVVHSLILTLQLEVILCAEGLQNAVFNLFNVVGVRLVVGSPQSSGFLFSSWYL